MNVVLLIGIQATGKSEFCKRYFYKTHIRLNLDMLKTRNRERILFDACLEAKQPVVIDNTNLTVSDRLQYISKAGVHGFKVVGYYFASSIEAALKRNNQREAKEKVPLAGVLSAHSKLQLPSYDEGFDELFYVRIKNNDFTADTYIDGEPQ